MPRYKKQRTVISARRARLAQDFVRDNPYLVAYYFYQRFKLFKKHVIILKFNVVDSQDRYKQQARGSIYSHSLYYCSGVLDLDKELSPNRSKFSIAQAARYQGYYILAMHLEPNPQSLLDKGLVLALPFEEIKWTFSELASILARCYKHRYTTAYCLRKDKNSGSKVCCFDAPQAIRLELTFKQPLTKSFLRFYAMRNHSRLNAYMRLLPLAQRANTNVQVCTSTASVVQYIGVYAAKGETQS